MVLKARQAFFLVSAIALIVAQMAVPLASSAQDAPENVDFVVGAFTCPYDPGTVNLIDGTLPGDCVPRGNVPVDVVVNGTESRTCTTGPDGLCFVSAPADASLLITQLSPDLAVQGTIARSAAEGNAVFIFIASPTVEPAPPVVETADSNEGSVTDDDPGDVDDGTEDTVSTPTEEDDADPSPRVSTGDAGSIPATPGAGDGFAPIVGYVIGAGEEGLACYATSALDASETPMHVFAEGDAITVTGNPVDGVVAVLCNEQAGFVDATFVTSEAPDVPPGGFTIAASIAIGNEMTIRSTVCRVTADPSGTAIATVAADTFIPVTGPVSGDWLPVLCLNGGISVDGYVLAVDTTAVAGTTPKVQLSVERVTTATACYSAPIASSSVIINFAAGAFVVRTGDYSQDWLSVQCAGRDGYVMAAHTTAFVQASTKPNLSLEQAKTDLACYTAPDHDAQVILTFTADQFFWRTGAYSQGWLPVKCGDRDGYVMAVNTTAFIQASTKPNLSLEQAKADLSCYTAPDRDAQVIHAFMSGEFFWRTGNYSQGWLPVKCGVRDGFVLVVDTTAFIQASTKANLSVEQAKTQLACYTAPDRDAQVIHTFKSGEFFWRTGDYSQGWLPVKCGVRDGYVLAANTTAFIQASTKSNLSMEQARSELVCYTAPDRDAQGILTFSTGDLFWRTGDSSQGWLPVKCGVRDGFVLVTQTSIYWVDPLRAGTGSIAILGAGSSGVVCRTSPDVNGTSIATFTDGALVVTTGAASNGWVPVQCGGRNGFVAAASTTKVLSHKSVSGNTYTAKVTGTGSGLLCRTAPVTGNHITTIPEGMPVEVYSWSEGWAKVRCGGTTGYASLQYLRFVTGETGVATGEFWIDINLTKQYMVVRQGNTILAQMYVSTGRAPLFETPTGTYYINNKVRIKDMAGCSSGECWYVRDVEYAMYFTNRGHAFHSAPWHNNFGTRMSHGCINLPPAAAEWLYNITAYGTRVYIHY